MIKIDTISLQQRALILLLSFGILLTGLKSFKSRDKEQERALILLLSYRDLSHLLQRRIPYKD